VRFQLCDTWLQSREPEAEIQQFHVAAKYLDVALGGRAAFNVARVGRDGKFATGKDSGSPAGPVRPCGQTAALRIVTGNELSAQPDAAGGHNRCSLAL
jgi:hypothetical protein